MSVTEFEPGLLYVDADGDVWFSDSDGYWQYASVTANGRFTTSGLVVRPGRENEPYRLLEGSVARIVRAWLVNAGVLSGGDGLPPPVEGRFTNLEIESR